MNQVCEIMRLYAEMGVKATNLYESCGSLIENNFKTLEKEGFVHGLIALKTLQHKPLKALSLDFEKILVSNIALLGLPAISQLFTTYSREIAQS